MIRRRVVPLLLAPVLLAGCAAAPAERVIVDTKGIDPAEYRRDLAECTDYAEQVDTSGRALGGAAAGATLWGVLGAILGDSDTAKRGAGAGGVVGGVKGAKSGYDEKTTIIRRCLSGRGYRVLN
jgi:uncharacterized protein YcfJ